MEEHKAVLWDLDNTILPSVDIMDAILHEIFPEFDVVPPTRQQLNETFSGRIDDFLRLHSDDHPDQGGIWDAFNETQQKHYEEVTLIEGVLEVIADFASKGLRQGIVTSRGNRNQGNAGAIEVVQNSGIGEYIDTVVCADDMIKIKPDPAPIRLALERLDVQPINAIMIGDSPVDMEAAIKAGVLPIGIEHEMSLDTCKLLLGSGAFAVRHRPQSLVPLVSRLLEV